MTQLQEATVAILCAEPLATIEEIADVLNSSREYINRIANKHGFNPETREAMRRARMQRYTSYRTEVA